MRVGAQGSRGPAGGFGLLWNAMAPLLDRPFANRAYKLRWLLIGGLIALSTYWSLSLNYERLFRLVWQESDQLGYYQFLPTLQGRHPWLRMPWTYLIDDRVGVSVFQIGTALLQAPFYFLGECLIWAVGMDDNGYGRIHAFTQTLGASTYCVLGLVFVFDTLTRLVRPWVALLTVVGLGLATNLFFYTMIDPGMSHVYSFFLFAWLARLTIRARTYLTPARLYGLLVCGALIVLVRAMNVWALLFPLLYGVTSVQDVRRRLLLLKRHGIATAAGAITALLLWAPQLWYWHLVTGRWYVNAYAMKGEHFHWGDPHPFDVLFSHQNGWFIYSPLMLFAVVSAGVMAWRRVAGGRAVLLIVGTTWWLYASWWCWWLGGGYGHRGFIEYYPLLAIPLAWGIERFAERARAVGIVLSVAVVAFLGYMNVNMTYLYEWPWERAEWTWDKLHQVWEHAVSGDRQRHFHPE